MYRTNKGNHNRTQHSSRFYGAKAHFRAKTNHVKKLDPNLFVKKAQEIIMPTESVSTVRFTDYDIVDKLKRNIQEHGYTAPTAIQDKAIPEILAGRDIIGIANTGTGKTAAFLITLINKSYLDRNQRVLIVVPTRELAIQIRDEFRIFAKGTDLEAVAIIGGSGIRRKT